MVTLQDQVDGVGTGETGLSSRKQTETILTIRKTCSPNDSRGYSRERLFKVTDSSQSAAAATLFLSQIRLSSLSVFVANLRLHSCFVLYPVSLVS